jgi:hypothetical protein
MNNFQDYREHKSFNTKIIFFFLVEVHKQMLASWETPLAVMIFLLKYRSIHWSLAYTNLSSSGERWKTFGINLPSYHSKNQKNIVQRFILGTHWSYLLKALGYPTNCGYTLYEVACGNNQIVLYMYSGKYSSEKTII